MIIIFNGNWNESTRQMNYYSNWNLQSSFVQRRKLNRWLQVSIGIRNPKCIYLQINPIEYFELWNRVNVDWHIVPHTHTQYELAVISVHHTIKKGIRHEFIRSSQYYKLQSRLTTLSLIVKHPLWAARCVRVPSWDVIII